MNTSNASEPSGESRTTVAVTNQTPATTNTRITKSFTVTPTATAEWQQGRYYNIGDVVSSDGEPYKAIQSHTANDHKPSAATAALWQLVSPACATEWHLRCRYPVGAVVMFDGQRYRAIQPHSADADNWKPSNTPALWVPV